MMRWPGRGAAVIQSFAMLRSDKLSAAYTDALVRVRYATEAGREVLARRLDEGAA